MSLPDFTIAQDCDLPVLDAVLKVDNVVFDLTGYTVTFSMKDANGKTILSSVATTVVNAATGQIRQTFSTAQTAKPGFYTGEWLAVKPAVGTVKFPKPGTVLIYIEPRIK